MTKNPSLNLRIPFNDGLVQGYYEDEENGLRHFHFYGTADTWDSLCNFIAFKLPIVHAGFKLQADRALSIIEGINGKDRVHWPKLYFTGHSLGGAIATLLTFSLKEYVIKCEVCGCPRVGGFIWWLLSHKLPVTRYEVKGDVVPKLPPWWLLWKHTGKVVKVPYTGEVKSDPIENALAHHVISAYSPHVPFSLE